MLSKRLDVLLDRAQATGVLPTRSEVEDLYTDGCAEMLTLEAEYLRTKRRLLAALIEGDGEGRSEAAGSLSLAYERLSEALNTTRVQLKQLRAALEWMQSENTLDPRNILTSEDRY